MVSDPSSILPKLMVFASPPLFSQAAIQNDFTSFPGQLSSTVRTGISTKVKPNADLPKARRVTSSCPQSPQPPVCSCYSRWPCLFLPENVCFHIGSSPFLRNRLIPPEQCMWPLRHCHFLPLSSFSTSHLKLVLYLMKMLKILLS